jgi:lipopolysaccharide/colanic/teichoic acid biosynthesis glycosyltransferase
VNFTGRAGQARQAGQALFGNFLDVFPQALNILKGEMSVTGNACSLFG